MNEKEAKEICINFVEENKDRPIILHEAIKILVSSVEKKDKQIDLMAEKFEDLKIAYLKKEDGGEFMGKYRTYNKNDWKQYFERKVENEN